VGELGALARESSTIRLGTMVTSATFRYPGPLAISVAQVDQTSEGRIELGIGAGWYETEHKAYGIPFPSAKERFDRLEEWLDDTRQQFGRVRDACSATGRNPDSLIYSAAKVVCCGANEHELKARADAIGRTSEDLRANDIAGTPAEVIDTVGRFADAGAQRLYLQFLDLSDLEHLELLASSVLNQV
jgi:alkanesulfonate monooxygenase SsuD/methylene tetrahydromethanopterin reductase-like flavin-dependent oxidoreductase (luciferase family)